MGRKTIRRGPGKRCIASQNFHLAEEIRYIQRRAAEHQGRFVTIGPLALFSTETGDTWLLDPADHLAARIARDGAAEPVHFEETILTSPSNGKATTALTATLSSTWMGALLASSASSAIQPRALRNWVDAAPATRAATLRRSEEI